MYYPFAANVKEGYAAVSQDGALNILVSSDRSVRDSLPKYYILLCEFSVGCHLGPIQY